MRRPWPPNTMPGSEVEHVYGLAPVQCPFCRSGNVGLFIAPLPHITCVSCGADGPLPDRGISPEHRQFEAVRLWNQR